MIKIENIETYGWEAAIRGMWNPMNSWEKSDSLWFDDAEYHDICGNIGPCSEPSPDGFDLGYADYELMKKLAAGGPVHAKYRRFITVTMDITAPLYWWKEFDTYKVGTVANSCSTMHKIHAKEFTLEDFSHEHLITGEEPFDEDSYVCFHDCNLDRGEICVSDIDAEYEGKPVFPMDILKTAIIPMLNECREVFLETKDKRCWWQMIQLLPSSYNQRRTVLLNYEVLHNIYISRKDHKLDEWREFCREIEKLPYSELITVNKE